jgi:hypothetical protein
VEGEIVGELLFVCTSLFDMRKIPAAGDAIDVM